MQDLQTLTAAIVAPPEKRPKKVSKPKAGSKPNPPPK